MTISNMLWAAATLSLYHEPFVVHMEHCAARRICTPDGMGLQPAATCLWALGRLSHVSPATCRLLATNVARALSGATARTGAEPQAASMAMHACAMLANGTPEERQLMQLGQRFLARHRRLASVQTLTVALWSSVVAGEHAQQAALAALLQVRPDPPPARAASTRRRGARRSARACHPGAVTLESCSLERGSTCV